MELLPKRPSITRSVTMLSLTFPPEPSKATIGYVGETDVRIEG